MSKRARMLLTAAAAYLFAASASAQQPLSAIDWLGEQAPAALPTAQPAPSEDEPAVTTNAQAPSVEVKPLTDSAPRRIGLVPSSVTGLPETLWRGSDVAKLTKLIDGLPEFDLPAAQALFFTLMLTEADAPAGQDAAGAALALTRVRALQKRGALDPAKALIATAGAEASPAHFETWMELSLLTGSEDAACAALNAAPHLSSDYAIRIFCQVRTGRWEDAALTFGSAQALELLDPVTEALMTRFLDPEVVDPPALPARPDRIDPLTFRLYETVGSPLSTRGLPRAYAAADLRDLAGWKAQIEAAERLARAGALPDNQLLGLYSARKAAASGSVWERVSRLQWFETAFSTGSAEAVTKTLPAVWTAMGEAGLQVAFANLFAADLAEVELEGKAAEIAQRVILLGPGYEAARGPGLAPAIAQGSVPDVRPNDLRAGAVYDAFDGRPGRADLITLAQSEQLGLAILRSLALVQQGTDGNWQALTDGLATLRALGLEDTARRAALQTLLVVTGP